MILALILACLLDRDCAGRVHRELYRAVLRCTDPVEQQRLRVEDQVWIEMLSR